MRMTHDFVRIVLMCEDIPKRNILVEVGIVLAFPLLILIVALTSCL